VTMGRTSNDDGDGGDAGDRRSRGGRRGRGRGGRGRGKVGGDGGEASRASVDAVPDAVPDAAPPGAPPGALRATSTPFIPRSVTVPNRGIAPPGAPAAAPLAPATKHRASRQRQRRRPKREEGGAEGDDAPTPADDPRARDDVAAAGEEAGYTGGEGEGEGKGKGKGKRKGTGGKPDGWWREISTCDPITLEPLAELDHPPFELRAKPTPSSPALSHLFDPTCLAEWVTGSKTFENPLTRAPMDASDCRRLDNHLRRCRLAKFAVHDAFVAAAHEREAAEERRAARANETSEAAAARREREAAELAASLFASIRARERRSRGPGRRGRDRDVGVDIDAEGHRRRRGDAFTADGAFAMVDDDEGMRGRRLGRRLGDETERWVWEDGSHLLYDDGDRDDGIIDDFPALGGGVGGGGGVRVGSDPNPEAEAAFPSLASATGTAVTAGSNGGWAATAARARSLPPPPSRPSNRVQSLPRSSNTAPSPNATEPPNATEHDVFLPTGPASEEDRAAREERRKKLADAFGVADPDSRPSSFAASSTHAFAPDVLATARSNPDAVDAMESALERLVLHGHDGATTTRRVRLDPMPRRLRAVAHALAATYGAASCSYGDEPRRRVDYFRSENTQFPSVRLSDALLVIPEGGTDGGSVTRGSVGAAGGGNSRLGPAPGDAWFPGYTEHHSRGRWSRLEVRFTDFNDVHVALAAVREYAERGDCACELTSAAGASHGALGGSGRWSEGMDLAVHFWKRSRYESAVGKIGGGIRGRFRATHICEVGPDPDPDDDGQDGFFVGRNGLDKLDANSREASRARAIGNHGRVGPSVPGAFGNPNKRRETPAADPWADDSVEEWNELLDDVD